jgi:signal transduction histidine kinase
VPAEVELDLPETLPSPVELAAWFVVSEALVNAAKHGEARSARVRLAAGDGRLRIEVADDGRGGADPDGSGLRGLRHRVEALDGTFGVSSPAGGPTSIRAELPCTT